MRVVSARQDQRHRHSGGAGHFHRGNLLDAGTTRPFEDKTKGKLQYVRVERYVEPSALLHRQREKCFMEETRYSTE
jgi:hypothetical protein